MVLTAWLGSFIRTTNINHARSTAEYSLRLSINLLNDPAGQSAVITPEQLTLTTRLMQASVATGTFVGATSWSGKRIATYAAEKGRIGHQEALRPGVRAALAGHVCRALDTSEHTGEMVGLLLFDLNRFKEVNDTFGHRTGDLLPEASGAAAVAVAA